ncbi:Polyadenylate-binding protein, cytoplasmic and nuclear [Wickerhamomyces ciferrii]|uniref:Polyadenylate-binding protein, cytoplasmic and nuclear n=1 Tax=Wickerhamomyces ciferrii (strain ATCC 14091 / BCRC 22168 / CBS 111 / JCM 3599 / NBRC 0793 / NRRL Y-1031 F-60-10) TaxID=1206466 RepID=K0KX00_WICCF|nr:Polyadenylate-binding protein, cytoplasmic and nuclear [Wickerhamomyces ciferrii]CCH46577.1 Polyadenylate-binding protein, cytoplasmic and nuclear [Wickerhamomyces ciferrii]
MDLASFLNDESTGGGSWADEEVDFASISIPVQQQAPSFGSSNIPGPNFNDPAFGGSERRERVEYPVPDFPPYRARLNNLPWDASEPIITEWVESVVGSNTTSNLYVPKDFNDSTRLKGHAFITFNEKEQLVQALTLSGTEMNGRRVFVNVAAPEKEGRRGAGGFGGDADLDWGSARGSGFSSRGGDDFGGRGSRGPPREEPDLDWGSARGSGPRGGDRGDRGERKPRREEPNLDWGAARTGPRSEPTGFEPREPRGDREPRERKPVKEEPNLDWSSARGTGVPSRGSGDFKKERSDSSEFKERKPRREEPELDWGSARGSGFTSRSSTQKQHNNNRSFNKPKTAADEANVWTRGQQPSGGAQRSNKSTSQKDEEKDNNKPNVVKSSFSVLAGEDDDEEDEEEEEVKEETKKEEVSGSKETGLEEATSKLNVDESSIAWETVGGKKK